MSFRGDVEQLSLINLYQALNLNKQGGVLLVTSGKLRRKVKFTPEGIRLLANGPGDVEPLRQVLLKLKLLTANEFSNVFGTKHAGAALLGDFFVQRRIIDPSRHLQSISALCFELILETFLWKPAKYEYSAQESTTDIELFSDATTSKLITFKVEGILIEVARREDEWKNIAKVVPSDKDIFVFVSPEDTPGPLDHSIDVSDEEFFELKRFVNAHKTIERIIDESKLTKFSVYRTLFILASNNIVRRLNDKEKLSLCDYLKRKGRSEEALDVYLDLVVDDPGNISIRRSIIEILEHIQKAPATLIEQYLYLARYYRTLGDIADATRYIDLILECDSSNFGALMLSSELLLLERRPNEALCRGKSALESALRRQMFQEGSTFAAKLLTSYPKETSLYHDSAELLLRSGDRDNSVRVLKQVAHIYAARRDSARLKKTIEGIAALDPKEGHALRRLVNFERTGPRALTKRVLPMLCLALCIVAVLAPSFYVIYERLCLDCLNQTSFELQRLVESGNHVEAVSVLSTIRDSFPLSFRRYKIAREIEQITHKRLDFEIHAKRRFESANVQFSSEIAQISTLINEGRYSEAHRRLNRLSNLHLSDIHRKKHEEMRDALSVLLKSTEQLLKQYRLLLAAGNIRDAHALLAEFLYNHPNAAADTEFELPLALTAVPAGAAVFQNGNFVGHSPLVVFYNPRHRFTLSVEKNGFKSATLVHDFASKNTFIDFSKDYAYCVTLARVPNRELQLKGVVSAGPIYCGNRIYCMEDRELFRCYDDSGSVLWTFALPSLSFAASGMIIWNRYACLITDDRRLVTVDIESRKLSSVVEPLPIDKSRLWFSEITDRGDLISHNGNDIGSYNLELNRANWSTRVEDIAECPILVRGNEAVLLTRRAKVVLLNLLNGTVLAEETAKLDSVSITCLGKGSVYAVSSEGVVFNINLASLSVVWSYRAGRSDLKRVSVLGDQLVITGCNGYVLALDAETGVRSWESQRELDCRQEIIPFEDTIVFGTERGLISALDLRTGAPVWSYQASNSLSVPLVKSANAVLGALSTGKLIAFTK